jgi:uncharacterized protein YejL (UPF0352 family)
MSGDFSGLVKAIGSLLDGFDADTVTVALGAVTIKHIVNSTRTETQAHDLAQRFAKTLRSSVADAVNRKGSDQ